MNQGTSKTLQQAIINGLNDKKVYEIDVSNRTPEEKLKEYANLIENHVGDYLAQKFTVVSLLAKVKPLDSDRIIKFFDVIVGEQFLKRRKGG